MSTRREILHRIATPLIPLYGEREARQIALVVLSEHTGLTISALLADPGCPQTVDGLDRIVDELTAGRPVQYVLGAAEFCGLRIGVRERVLIPRPETEELVQWVAQENPRRILDVGTGSGCIALALKNLLPPSEVFGADISQEALALAHENAERLGLEITFRQADALFTPDQKPNTPAPEIPGLFTVFPDRFDTIVSNPPYIPASELAAMRRNVTGFEPELALFVPDDDPLRFYRAIARTARKMLTPEGKLYYEIHENFGDELCALLRDEGFGDITLRRDFLDKPRMICCRNAK